MLHVSLRGFPQESSQPCKPECGLCSGWKWKLSSFWRRSLINWTACWKGWRALQKHSAVWEGRGEKTLRGDKVGLRTGDVGVWELRGNRRWKQKALSRASHRGLWCMRLYSLIVLPVLHPITRAVWTGECSIYRLHWTDQWINLVDTAEPHFHFNVSQTPNSLSTFLSCAFFDCPVSRCTIWNFTFYLLLMIR